MLFDRHPAASAADVFEQIRYEAPNYSGRMDNLRAAILRPQLARLDTLCRHWNERYRVLKSTLTLSADIWLPARVKAE